MSLKNTLISCVREAQNATQEAAQKFDNLTKTYQLSQDGRTAEAKRYYQASQTAAEAAKARGLAAIQAKASEIDSQESARQQQRNGDAAYLNRLEAKLRILSRVDLGDVEKKDLREMFAEFADDPVAISAISKTCGRIQAGGIIPENNRGKRQLHLLGTVANGFIHACNRAGAELPTWADLATGVVLGHQSEIDAFISYCEKQNDEFSLDDMDVWAAVRSGGDPAQGEAEPVFGFQFRTVR